MSLTREEFIRKIKDDVMKDAKISKILPSLTIAQAILESNNGNSGLAVKGKALFGIKANSSWKGKVYVSDTKEVYSGVQYTVKASFRAYNNWAESISDHTKLLISLKRYSNIIGEKNYVQACKKIQQDGYATDPYYASKLINIIESNQLFNYDDYEEDEKPSKSSYFVVVLTAIAAGIVIIVVAFIAIMLINVFDKDEPPVIGKMPNLRGLSYQEVANYYASSFDVVVENKEFSSEYPEGAIIDQTPAEGKDYMIGNSTVKLIVSKGPRMVTVTNVYELDSTTAMSMLKDNDGFNVLIKSVTDETVPKDFVIKTEPARNEKVAYGSTVYMYVSRGPEVQDVVVPKCVGRTLEEARTLLGDKFTIQTMTKDSLEPEGTVIEQSIPDVGEDGQPNIVKINSTIILTLSTGNMPEAEAVITFRVPDGIKGKATFNCYVNGTIIGTTTIDNLAYASTVSVDIKGTEMQKVVLEAVNEDNDNSDTIGEYSVDFVENTVTEVNFDKKVLKNLFSEKSNDSGNSGREPIVIDPDDDIVIDDPFDDDDDNAFWNDVFGY